MVKVDRREKEENKDFRANRLLVLPDRWDCRGKKANAESAVNKDSMDKKVSKEMMDYPV